MDFSKPRNLILLILSLIVIISLSINASLAWFNISANQSAVETFSVLKFDFKTNGKFKEEVSVPLVVSSPNNYSKGYIAPGVRGYHTFEFSNAGSDVPVEYTVTFNKNNSTVPSNMVFYKDSSYSQTMTSGVVWQNVRLEKGATGTQTFGFEWKFETTDSANSSDKAFKEQNGVIVLKFTVTATQV